MSISMLSAHIFIVIERLVGYVKQAQTLTVVDWNPYSFTLMQSGCCFFFVVPFEKSTNLLTNDFSLWQNELWLFSLLRAIFAAQNAHVCCCCCCWLSCQIRRTRFELVFLYICAFAFITLCWPIENIFFLNFEYVSMFYLVSISVSYFLFLAVVLLLFCENTLCLIIIIITAKRKTLFQMHKTMLWHELKVYSIIEF